MSTIEERVAALESALASMTAAEKRIVELPAASSVANDDFVALDGVANGSRRFAASNLGGKAEPMSVEEWDALPDSKLSDCKVYALSGVSPSTQDNPLWQKLGFAALDTQADDCSDAINELNTGLTTLNSNIVKTAIIRIDITPATNSGISGFPYAGTFDIPINFAYNRLISIKYIHTIMDTSNGGVALVNPYFNWGDSSYNSDNTLFGSRQLPKTWKIISTLNTSNHVFFAVDYI